MALAMDEAHLRALALLLPTLTLTTHTLLTLSFLLPSTTQNPSSLSYNIFAAVGSILGLLGAIRRTSSLVTFYATTHTITLSFLTLTLATTLLNRFSIPTGLSISSVPNPVLPAWPIDPTALCSDIDAASAWADEWVSQCIKSFDIARLCVAGLGLILMGAQWWALAMVRRWGRDMGELTRKGDVDVEREGEKSKM